MTTIAKWIEGEPSEADGSAWDRLPPLVKAAARPGAELLEELAFMHWLKIECAATSIRGRSAGAGTPPVRAASRPKQLR
jgi:hypothetical protein